MAHATADEIQTTFLIAMIITSFFWLKCHFVFFNIGGKRIAGGDRMPEDKYQKAPSGAEKEKLREEAERYKRAGVNDFENVFLGLFLIWGNTLSLQYDGAAITVIVLACAFAFFRLCHTIFYINSISYGRTASYMLGQVCCIALMANGIANMAASTHHD
mmetsp:Transcript_25391/g.71256  ORF Transcript_25391/g.71256 Transcript_25391/m.71256 type:complete len:159 (+) Transcript_25391:165-641(+)